MILVAFLRVMPGTTFLSTMTTRGIELFQSLWRSTFHGSSGLALFFVRLRSALLGFVAGILSPLWHSAETDASSKKTSLLLTPRTKPDTLASRARLLAFHIYVHPGTDSQRAFL